MRFVLRGLGFSLLVAAQIGFAQHRPDEPSCTFDMSRVSFGQVDVKSQRPAEASGTLRFACTGDRREMIRICPSWGLTNGSRWLIDRTGNKLYFNLFIDPSMTTLWGSWYNGRAPGPTIDVPVGRSRRVTGTITAYGRIDDHQGDVKPGAYHGSLSYRDVVITYGYTGDGRCGDFNTGKPSAHASFDIDAFVVDGSTSTQPALAASPQYPAAKLRNGLTRAQVEELFGPSNDAHEDNQNGIAVTKCSYQSASEKLSAEYVNNVLVRYTVSSR